MIEAEGPIPPAASVDESQQLAMQQLDEVLRMRFDARTMEEYLAKSPKYSARPSTPPRQTEQISSSSSISPSRSLTLSALQLDASSSPHANSDEPVASKPNLYARTGKQKDRIRPLRLSRHRSYVSQLNEVCQRMAWPAPEWKERSAYGRSGLATHSASLTISNEHRDLLVASIEAINSPTKVAAREQAAQQALEQILEYA